MRITASVGSSILGVSRSSNRMSPGAYKTVPRMADLLLRSLPHSLMSGSPSGSACTVATAGSVATSFRLERHRHASRPDRLGQSFRVVELAEPRVAVGASERLVEEH